MTPINTLSAVLFDMDGTVIDTEPVWFAAERAYVAQYGKTWSDDDALGLVGAPASVTTQRLIERTGTSDTHEQIMQYLLGFLLTEINEGRVPVRPGIPALIEKLKEAKVPIALVTSSPQIMVDAFLARMPASTFDAVVTSDDVVEHKPSPEPYLQAAELLRSDPARCVVLEDSPSGIASGMSAGANVVAIPCIVDLPAQENLSRVGSAEDLDLPLLEKIATGFVVDNLDN